MRRIIFFLLMISCFSCKRKWTEKDKSEFLAGCLKNAVKNIGEQKAKPYCNCLLQRVIERYPNARDAPYIKYDTAIVRLAEDCLKQH